MNALELTGHRIYIVPHGTDISGIVSDKWPHQTIGPEPSESECKKVMEWMEQNAKDDDVIVFRPMTTLRRYKEWIS